MSVSRPTARRFLRRALGLDLPHATVAAALAHHGFVQLDPIDVCGRMHDLILRTRVARYREGDLLRHVHEARGGFEHYLPNAGILVAYPLDAWPFLRGRIESRRLRRGALRRKLSARHERIAEHILGELRARGPLTSDEIEHDGRTLTAWGTPGRLVKTLLDVLLVHGRVSISSRRNFRRVYDLPERVLPPEIRDAPSPTEQEIERWIALLRVRQRRLVTLRREDLARCGDAVAAVHVEDCPPLYCLREDLPRLEQAAGDDTTPASIALLAPLDPLIYDRRVTSALWDFDYTWEVYTPPAKRVRGYYALPVLAGTDFVGHVEPRAERAAGKLVVVSRRIQRGRALAPALDEFADWLGLRRA